MKNILLVIIAFVSLLISGCIIYGIIHIDIKSWQVILYPIYIVGLGLSLVIPYIIAEEMNK